MASDFVSRNPPALPSASVPWPRRAAWRRLWRDDTDASLLVSVSLRGAAGSASVKRRVRRSPWQLTFCVAWSVFPFMLSGRLGKLLAQSYQQLFAKLFTLLERLNLLEKLGLQFPNQIRLLRLELPILLEKLKLLKLRKPEKWKTRFLNQIK
jgi:hypothetical protein